MRKIIFRADASTKIGYGHFIRTLALADMLKEHFECLFITIDPTAYQQQEMGKVCPFTTLSRGSHFEDFLNLLQGEEIVVLDNYFFDTEYQRKIKTKGCKLVCIDDMHDKHYVADVVINHALTEESLFSVESYTRLCLGLNWALLRKPFLEKKEKVKREKGHCLVSFGGVDWNNLTEKFARILSVNNNVNKITAIVGDAYTQIKELEKISKVEVVRNLTAQQMAEFFAKVEFAVLSSSTIAIEAIMSDCPVFGGYYVDNQIEYYHALKNKGYIMPLGDLLHDELGGFDLLSLVEVVKPQYDIRKDYLDLFRGLMFRIVDYVDLTESESKQVWFVRNLPEIRQYMTNTEMFDFETHCQFIETLRNNEIKKYWAVFERENLIGGYSLVNINSETGERGIFISPQYQKSGMGRIIEEKMDSILLKMGIVKLNAEIKINNSSSIKYHLQLGYIIQNKDDFYFYLQKRIKVKDIL